jgi:hypothetical protein
MPLFTPVAPTISSITSSGFTITRNPDGNPGGTYYVWMVAYNTSTFYCDGSGGLSSTPIFLLGASQTVSSLPPNTTASVALAAALDSMGTGETGFGPAASATTLATSPINQPYQAVFSTTVTAYWLQNGNPNGTVYDVQLSPDPSFTTGVIDSGFTITAPTFQFINLLPSTIYYGQVRARNAVLVQTPFVLLGPVTTLSGPANVRALQVTNLLDDRGFLLEWAPNIENNIVAYKVYRSSSPTDVSSFALLNSTPANVTSYIDHVPFTFGLVYYYIVTALDNGGNESPLDTANPTQDMSFHSFEEQPFPTVILAGDIINDETPSGSINGVHTTITTVTDATHLVVGSTAGWTTGAAVNTTANTSFTVVTVTDGTHLVVSSTSGMHSGDVLIQGNALFTTAYPYKHNTLSVYLNGVKLMGTSNFVLNPPQQFTLLVPPVVGDNLRISYVRY